jgi:mercuric ion binding protein
MSPHLAAAATLAVLLSAGLAQAADKTVVLNVKNADCVLCHPIVKTSLSRVPGRQGGRNQTDRSNGSLLGDGHL